MSRKQYAPPGSSHEKKLTRKERKKQRLENPNYGGNNEVTVPDDKDKKQLRMLTLFTVIGLVLLLFLMYYIFVSSQ